MEDNKKQKYPETEPMLHTLVEPWHRFDPEYWEQYRDPAPPVPYEWDAVEHSLLEPWHLFDEENWDQIEN